MKLIRLNSEFNPDYRWRELVDRAHRSNAKLHQYTAGGWRSSFEAVETCKNPCHLDPRLLGEVGDLLSAKPKT